MLKLGAAASKSVVALLAALALSNSPAKAQSSTTTARTPGAPAGAYHLSDADTVNLFNGNLNYHLPLLRVGGRGEAGAELGVVIEGQNDWQEIDLGNGNVQHQYSFAQPNPLAFVGRVNYGITSYDLNEDCGTQGNAGTHWFNYRGAMTYVEPDGTQHLLRDRIVHGLSYNICAGQGFDLGNVFESTDGSLVTFVTDASMHLSCALNGDCTNHTTGYLFFPDGSKSRVVDSLIQWTQDRNGNRIDYTYDLSSSRRLTAVTDSLGRQATIEYSVRGSAPYGDYSIHYKGYGNQDRVITVSLDQFSSALLRNTQPGDTTQGELFYDAPGDNVQMTVAGGPAAYVSAVTLPNGRGYQFKYNSLGQLARVDLPTGGAIEYDYADIPRLPFENASFTGDPKITNAVSVKRVYDSNNAPVSRTVFSTPTSYTPGVIPFSRNGTVRDVDVFDPAGNSVSKSRHYFYGLPSTQLGADAPWWHGREFRTEAFGTGGTILQVGESDWRQRAPAWCPSVWPCNTNPSEQAPTNSPFVVETRTALADANLISKVSSINPADQSWAVDAYNNRTDVWEYGYGAGQAGGLLRHTHRSYINNLTQVGSVYLFSRPDTTSVYGVNPVTGQEYLASSTQIVYDEYALYPLQFYGTNMMGWQDPGNVRGNPTTVRRWLDTAGAWLEARAEYDQFGNVVAVTDARTITSTVSYADSFSDGLSRNTYAFPTTTTSAVPDPTGQRGASTPLTTSTVYDYSTGLVTSATDANGKTTTAQYNDALDRLTRVGRPDGGSTTYNYYDWLPTASGTSAVETLTALDASRSTYACQFFDGLGRKSRSFLSDGAQFQTVDTQYDALGRVSQVSNPYTSAGSAAAINPSGRWTASGYDALGRVVSVTTPDGAAVRTTYDGARVLVTDQAGRQRISTSDALGRLTDVWEVRSPDPASGTEAVAFPAPAGVPAPAAGYRTHYDYDALGNLRKVNQGGQLRYFMYDSLSRLVRAKNPEQAVNTSLNLADTYQAPGDQSPNAQWSMYYDYDADGNPWHRTDARNVTTTYGYDNLNRLVRTDYNDGVTAYTLNTYDFAINGKGRYYSDYESSTQGTINLVLEYDAAGRPKSRKTNFYLSGTGWIDGYAMSRVYDLAGNVTSQTYASGRTVSYKYDAAGRLADQGGLPAFSGNLGDGFQRTYAAGLSYNEAWRMQQEQFGTNVPLYHKLHYNARGQLYDVRLSTVAWAADQWNWNRGCLAFYRGALTPDSTANNGDVTAQQHWVPGDDQISTYTYTQQNYGYDALNRLASMNEYRDGAYSFQQAYAYDRWGNRQIDAANTTDGLNKRQFTIDTTSNRLYSPVGGMAYDPAGNQTVDTYSASSARRQYDAENRMTLEQNSATSVFTRYTYDAVGRRTRRDVGGGVTWMIYGFDGELAAEYAPGAPFSQPRKEYGYRGGELLVTAEPPAGSSGAQPVAWQNAVGVTVSGNSLSKPGAAAWDAGASSAQSIQSGDGYAEFTTSETSTYRMFGLSHGDTNQDYPDIDFALEPAPEGLVYVWEAGAYRGVSVPYASGDRFRVAVEGGVVKYYKLSGGATALIYTSGQAPAYPLLVDTSLFSTGAQITNAVIAGAGQGSGGGGGVRWLVSDHLGTPRVVADQTGSLSGITRHDYFPFGEEIGAEVGGRTTGQGYVSDNLRFRFGTYERDNETGLDYAQARYYASAQGRFTSPDPLAGTPARAQSWNRYAYCVNNPLKHVDPSGLWWYTKNGGDGHPEWFDNDPGEGYTRFTQYSYYGGEENGYVALDPFSKNYLTGFKSLEDATAFSNSMAGATMRALDPGQDVSLLDGALEMSMYASGVTGIVRGGSALLSEEGISLLGRRGAATAAEEVAGLYGRVTVSALEEAASSSGPVVEVVTKLTQMPQAGRALSVATGEGAEAVANAARSTGQLYRAAIPRALLEQMERSGLAIKSTTQMAGSNATAVEYRFLPQATKFVTQFFKQ